MKIAIIPNLTRQNAAKITADVCLQLDKFGAEYYLDSTMKNVFSSTCAEFDNFNNIIKNCDIIISIGGDGTIIHAAKHSKPVLGINAGRIAFMAGLEAEELELLVKVISGDYEIDKRMMLKVQIIKNGTVIKEDYCINDVVVARGEQIKMVEISAKCDGKLINNYTTDGIIVATPTGSTAYSLSAGGPVIDPQIESIILTPICTHSLFSRALIFKPSATITLESNQDKDLSISCDGDETIYMDSQSTLVVTKAPIFGKFIRIKNDTFMDILNDKLAQRRI